jgi:hypothetical protein
LALRHLVKRHGGRVEGFAIVEAEVPRAWLRRNRRGLWLSVRDVPPERLRWVVTFAELAGAVTPAACYIGSEQRRGIRYCSESRQPHKPAASQVCRVS